MLSPRAVYVSLLRQAGDDVRLIMHGLAESEVSDTVAFLKAAIARPPMS